MISGNESPAAARVFVLITDPDDFSKKKLIRLKGFTNVTSTLSIDGVGGASVVLPNMDLKYLRARKKPDYDGMPSAVETMLLHYQTNAPNATISDTVNALLEGKYFDVWFSPQDLIWIDYRGRDGLWYPGFSGIITSSSESIVPGMSPTVTLQAKDYRRILQYCPVVWGARNLSGKAKFDSFLTDKQEQFLSSGTKLSEMSISKLFQYVLNTVEKLLHVETGEVNPFFSNSFWLENESSFPEQRDLVKSEQFSKTRQYINPPEEAYLKSPLATAWYDAMFYSEETENIAYKSMIRSKFGLYNTEFDFAGTILNKIAQASQSFVYVDAEGNIRHEYPRYGDLPTDSIDIGDVDDSGLTNHGANYYVAEGDASFLKFAMTDDETMVVANRVTFTAGVHYLTLAETPTQTALTAISQSDEKTMLKYGLRNASFSDVYLNEVPKMEAIQSYADALRSQLNSASRSFSVDLRQRPELQLNRTMVFLDRMAVGLITSMTDTFSPTAGHTRHVNCKFVYKVGDPNKPVYPWIEV